METAPLKTASKLADFTRQLTVAASAVQQRAHRQLMALDFPTSRQEYWKYSRLGKLTAQHFSKRKDTEHIDLSEYIVADDYLVVVNGFVREDLSQYASSAVEVTFLDPDSMDGLPFFNASSQQSDAFFALNTAYFDKGIHLRMKGEEGSTSPLQIIWVTRGQQVVANNRLYIEATAHSKSEVITTFASAAAENCLTNQVTEVHVAEHAQLTLQHIQAEAEHHFQVATTEVRQESNSTVRIHTATLSGGWIRNNCNVTVVGEQCETHLNGVVVAKDKQHVDHHTFVDHCVPHCSSHEQFRYVLDGKSSGVFNGKVMVHPDAQKTNAYQSNGNLLLSDKATINAKPELEIYADDVKCSHGSTTGQLDKSAVFYLQTRGISKRNAQALLVQAFVDEVIRKFENEAVIGCIHSLLSAIHYGKEKSQLT